MYAIEFNNVWKKFKKGDKAITLRDAIPQFAKKLFSKEKKEGLKDQEFWAVKDVSFKVKKGEVLGIIGPNGAGKSTILKLLSKIMRTSSGEFKINGRLSALIEVTAGFHPDFTGRENVYFNGSIFGMTRKEVDEKFEQIVDFSGVRDFIDTPVKRYSSGMQARLGFAIAAHVDPDVLLVDEVLSVGDKTFQAKCTEKMRELVNSGVTIVFISHNIGLVQSLCERIILLHHGEVIRDGKPEEVVPEYENLIHKMQEEDLKKKISTSNVNFNDDKESIVQIKNVRVLNAKDEESKIFNTGDSMAIEITYQSEGKIEGPEFSYNIIRADGVICCYANSIDEKVSLPSIDGVGKVLIEFDQTPLMPGVYFIKSGIWDKDRIHSYDILKKGIFTIKSNEENINSIGIFKQKTSWKHEV